MLPEVSLGQESAARGPVRKQVNAALATEGRHAHLGPAVDQRKLDLVGDHANAMVEDAGQPLGVEVREREVPDGARVAQIGQARQRVEVPPVGVLP